MYASIERDLDVLSVKLRRAQAAYQAARSMHDHERIHQYQIQIDGIISERDRLLGRLSRAIVEGCAPAA